MRLHAACKHFRHFFLGYVVPKLCSMVIFLLLSWLVLQQYICSYMQLKWNWKHFFHFKHTPAHNIFWCSLTQLLANTHTHIYKMVIVWGSFSIFSPYHMGVSGIVFLCVHSMWTCFVLASTPFNFNGISSICSWSLLQFVFYLFWVRHSRRTSPLRFSAMNYLHCSGRMSTWIRTPPAVLKTYALNSVVTSINRKPWSI